MKKTESIAHFDATTFIVFFTCLSSSFFSHFTPLPYFRCRARWRSRSRTTAPNSLTTTRRTHQSDDVHSRKKSIITGPSLDGHLWK